MYNKLIHKHIRFCIITHNFMYSLIVVCLACLGFKTDGSQVNNGTDKCEPTWHVCANLVLPLSCLPRCTSPEPGVLVQVTGAQSVGHTTQGLAGRVLTRQE